MTVLRAAPTLREAPKNLEARLESLRVVLRDDTPSWAPMVRDLALKVVDDARAALAHPPEGPSSDSGDLTEPLGTAPQAPLPSPSARTSTSEVAREFRLHPLEPAAAEIHSLRERCAELEREIGRPFIVERGPWSIAWGAREGDGRDIPCAVISSDDFTHDVWMFLTGDFGGKDKALAYAQEIARRLNAYHEPVAEALGSDDPKQQAPEGAQPEPVAWINSDDLKQMHAKNEPLRAAAVQLCKIFEYDTPLYAGALPAVPQEPLSAKPCEWELNGATDCADKHYGFYIQYIDDDVGSEWYAAWGEGDGESFATLQEAKDWCQGEVDRWVRTYAVVAQTLPAAPDAADAKRWRHALKHGMPEPSPYPEHRGDWRAPFGLGKYCLGTSPEDAIDAAIRNVEGTPLAAALPAPSVPAGWKLVPIEPTQEMLEACETGTQPQDWTTAMKQRAMNRATYKAMLAAAPSSLGSASGDEK